MIEPSRPPLSFAEGLIQEEVGPLWEEWMRQIDEVLADRELVQIVYEALARRWPQSRTRGRPATPAEVVLRLLLLKHMRNWGYRVLEREVRANLVYRQFTRVGAQKVPDAKTLGRLALALGPEIIEQLHCRVVTIACEKRIVRGRRLRVDTTVVETDIHYPTDSSLLGDGVRVLTRAMKRMAAVAGRAGSRMPYLITADAAFFSHRNALAAQARGVKRVAIPNFSPKKSAQRKQLEKKRWFRNAQRWRTGCEGRIRLLKRRHGLNRSRYKGMPGIQRWVGLGVIADNLINLGHALAPSAKS